MIKDKNFYKNGEFSTKALNDYLYNHKNDKDVIELRQCPGDTNREKYNYFMGLSNESSSQQNLNLSDEDIKDIESGKAVPLANTVNYETGEATSSVLTKSTIVDELELLKLHNFDPEKWTIVSASNSAWDSGYRKLNSSKIKVRPRDISLLSPEMIMKKFDNAVNYKAKPFNFAKPSGKSILVIPIADLHYGLLAEKNTTDNEYNMAIAEERLKKFIDSVCSSSAKLANIGQVLLTIGNDFFNADNVFGETTKGTPQDNDKSYFTIFDKGVRLVIDIIEKLVAEFPKAMIDVASVQGNHDKQSSHALMTALYYKYNSSKNVNIIVESDEKARFYYTYGSNLFGFGHETKIKECHRIMSSEAKNWSLATHKTFFLGHLHKEEVLDNGTLVIRRLPILSGRSIWTTEQGYDSAPRAQAFLFDRADGLSDIINVNF